MVGSRRATVPWRCTILVKLIDHTEMNSVFITFLHSHPGLCHSGKAGLLCFCSEVYLGKKKKKNTASPWNIFHNNCLGLVTVIRWMLPQFMHGESKAKRVKITDLRWDRWEFWNSEQQIVINIDGRFPGVPALPRMSTSHSFIMVVNLRIFNSIWTLPLYGPYGWMSGLSASLYSPQCPRLRHKHLEHSFLNRKVFLHQGVKSLWGLPSPWP